MTSFPIVVVLIAIFVSGIVTGVLPTYIEETGEWYCRDFTVNESLFRGISIPMPNLNRFDGNVKQWHQTVGLIYTSQLVLYFVCFFMATLLGVCKFVPSSVNAHVKNNMESVLTKLAILLTMTWLLHVNFCLAPLVYIMDG
jgi:hypothetical protein